MRDLASIQIVEELSPIPDADAIEVARVLGWKCVVKKGDFQPGDRCVYFEVDSILPEDVPALAFAAKFHYRVKTIKLRGQISQGLAIPLSEFPWLAGLETGADVSDKIGSGVKKHMDEQLDPRGFRWGRSFPSFVRKTDETRIQSCAGAMLSKDLGPWYITEKLDGTSFTAYYNNGKFGVCSRNTDLDEADGNLYWEVAKKYGIHESLPKFCTGIKRNLAVQGEIIGPRVQGNWYSVDENKLYVFGVYGIEDGAYESYARMQLACATLCLPTVPIMAVSVYLDGKTVDDIVDMAQGVSMLCDVQREGLVFRTMEETVVPRFGHASFKAINPVFLLKRGQ